MSEPDQNENNNNNNNKEIDDNINDIKESKNGLNTDENKQENSENKVDYIFSKLQHTNLVVNQLDYYANSIPLGSFCFAISFILNGLFECQVHKRDDQLLYLVIFMFGGVGQILNEHFKFQLFPSIPFMKENSIDTYKENN